MLDVADMQAVLTAQLEVAWVGFPWNVPTVCPCQSQLDDHGSVGGTSPQTVVSFVCTDLYRMTTESVELRL